MTSLRQRMINDMTVRGLQYASCRNRHCPKCQTLSQTRWVERQCAGLLDIGYWHVVFTLPHELNPVAQGNPALIYRLLFKAASQTLLEFGRNPRWLGGELGITMVLHTWGQNLGQHIHVHCIVTDGGLSPDGQRWMTPVRKGFLFTRLRHYGLLANRCRVRKLDLCRALLRQPVPEPREPETAQEMMLRLTGIDITACQQCGRGTPRQILILEPQHRTVMRAMRTGPP